MENTPDLPIYDDAARVLHEAGVPTGASEAHGIITGVLCAPTGARVAWQTLILGRDVNAGHEPSAELSRLLAALEETFGIQVSVEELELDDFRSVARIARFLARHPVSLSG